MQYRSVFSHLVSPRRRPVAAQARWSKCLVAIPFEGPVAPSLARHSDRTNGQCPGDLGSSGRPLSAAAVVQPQNLSDSS